MSSKSPQALAASLDRKSAESWGMPVTPDALRSLVAGLGSCINLQLIEGRYPLLNGVKRLLRAAQTGPGVGFKIEDRIVLKDPSPQTALDIFKGTWISKLPGDFSRFEAGTTPLFEDSRIPRSEEFLGPVAGMDVLDLGPLEGGQAYVLQKLGARSVVSVEANSILYLKCLVAKEVLGMDRVKFLCGDVVAYLKNSTTPFDMCVASGILYHMDDPVELLWLLSQRSRKLMIWTHHFDEVDTARNKINSFRPATTHDFQGVSYSYHRQEYGVGFTTNVYCGGTQTHSHWMTRAGIETALRNFGYTNINVLDDADSMNGPFLLLTASK
jgi:protein-L-isoaspartate O-methyltransferase